MKEYSIDIGNSSNGPVGAVIYIEATSRKNALKRFRDLVGDVFEDQTLFDEDGNEVGTLNTYFGHEHITLNDVEEVR